VASDQAKELRKRGIAAAKAGEVEEARQLLQQSLRAEPQNEAAWLWLVSLARDQREKMFYLNRLLEINPSNDMGIQALKSLGMTREQLAGQVSSLPSRPDNRAKIAASAQTPGIPVPDANRLQQVSAEAEEMLTDYLDLVAKRPTSQWVEKTKGRAGERDIWGLRGAIAGAITVGIIVLFLAGYGIVWNTPALRGLVFVPTPTLTPTRPPPTVTATPTPGDTPTPSPTPRLTSTPSPTVPPALPNGNVAPPIPTRVFPPAFAKGVQDSIQLIDRGRYAEALPTLRAEITSVANSFDPAPYYFTAMALIGEKEYAEAKQIMLDAQARLTDTTDRDTRAVVIGALAYTNLLLGQQAIAEARNSESGSFFAEAEQQANEAIEASPRFNLPYLTIAGTASVSSNYTKALEILDQGLAVPELISDVQLIVEKGDIYFAQRDYDKADYQAYLALYIDPTTESAHKLRIKTAMAEGDAGLAVLYSQAYLFYYPGSVEGYVSLAQARGAEGKNDLALQAFSQALTGGEDNVDVLTARAELYLNNKQYKLAQTDLSKIYQLTQDDEVRAQRMLAAFEAGDRATAGRDATALLGSGVIPDAQINLIQVRIMIDRAQPDDTETYQEAIDLLSSAEGLPTEQRPIADEYQAKAALALKQYEAALNAINSALAAGETGTRHYIRGMILQAQGRRDAAFREYDWVLTWSTVYAYPFIDDVRERAEELR